MIHVYKHESLLRVNAILTITLTIKRNMTLDNNEMKYLSSKSDILFELKNNITSFIFKRKLLVYMCIYIHI